CLRKFSQHVQCKNVIANFFLSQRRVTAVAKCRSSELLADASRVRVMVPLR
ncbi:hypothetical protein TNCT_216991, partial [Trichonephila clavata]